MCVYTYVYVHMYLIIGITSFSYHIPEIKIVTCEPLRPGKASELLLKFCNPTQHQTQITILPLDTSLSTVLVEEREDLKQENMQQVMNWELGS